MIFKCDNCGEIPKIIVDGSEIDGTCLKGIKFEVEDKNGSPKVNMREQDHKYFSKDVVKEYEKKAAEIIHMMDTAQCPICNKDVYIEYFQKVMDDKMATEKADEMTKSMSLGNIAKNIKNKIQGLTKK